MSVYIRIFIFASKLVSTVVNISAPHNEAAEEEVEVEKMGTNFRFAGRSKHQVNCMHTSCAHIIDATPL